MARTEPFDKYLTEYENWFEINRYVYGSEVDAVRHFIPAGRKGIEIGIGSGRFAVPLKIKEGIEPSAAMRDFSSRLGLKVYDGTAENIPLKDNLYDFVLMVTTICFVDDAVKALMEAKRILKPGGYLIIGLVDKKSTLGRIYESIKEQNKFYKYATFYSTEDIKQYLKITGFCKIETIQTVFGELHDIRNVQKFKEGFGEGGFVVIKAEKIVYDI
ncbi:MAG: class I SAM-dependent methyltransferase [Melioribacteraceae bacterium]|nr:class I SAM-dependent methyltransferase [Melioribacteraceae bacterium]